MDDETHDGTRTIRIEADTLDVAEFDATITAIADALAGLGNTDRTDLRRATAVGLIADPQATLDLLGTSNADQSQAQRRRRRRQRRRRRRRSPATRRATQRQQQHRQGREKRGETPRGGEIQLGRGWSGAASR